MRIVGIIVGIILILLGGLWVVQGSNMMPNTAMSGQSQWLYIGIVVAIVGLVALIWSLRRRA
jgi:LPXTG-motif cell wall-anchored protein